MDEIERRNINVEIRMVSRGYIERLMIMIRISPPPRYHTGTLPVPLP